MNFNKILCRYLNTERKGYVTIGDVLWFLLALVFCGVVVIGVGYSFYQGYIMIISNRIFCVESFDELLGAYGIMIGTIIIIALVSTIVCFVCSIKITKCDVKKEDTQERSESNND